MALTADIQQQVFDLLSRASNISFVTADQESGSSTLLVPGQRVSAEVLLLLPHNRAQVRVGGERFNLDLPMAVHAGQTLDMTFVSADPRSTFAIARQGGIAPPVSLSDASRLLSMLVSQERVTDPAFRSSLQNIGGMLRRSSGETGVLANLLDEALTYGVLRETTREKSQGTADSLGKQQTPDSSRMAAFENNAAQILRTIAQNSRVLLVEAVNQPSLPLPFRPGEELDVVVTGTLPGGRVFVQVAGTAVEMILPRAVQSGDILRLTYISSEPKLTFAIPRMAPDGRAADLSEAGRWLSMMERGDGGGAGQQKYVLERLSAVLKSLPPDSPAFTLIRDEAITYGAIRSGEVSSAHSAVLQASLLSTHQEPNGIVLSDDMAKLLQAVFKGQRLALLETLNQQSIPTGFAPGQQLKGEVLAALGGGRFMVQVASRNMEFILPKGLARGDTINLFFIAEEPQQTFLMARFGRPGDSRVSDTGRWLSGFLGEAAGHVPAQAALGILQTLLAGPTNDAPLLSRLLQRGLRESGLFYESHLASWFGGDYPLEDILQEPQGRLSPRLGLAGENSAIPAEELVRTSIRTGSAEIMEALLKKAGTSMGHEGIADQRTLPTVSAQLTSLQSGQLLFQGDLFPGQRMEWTVDGREKGRNKSGGRERSWSTGVTINLPHLGAVTALLAVDGDRIAVKIRAADSLTVPVLEAGRLRLAEQLEGAGLTPTEMSINHAPA